MYMVYNDGRIGTMIVEKLYSDLYFMHSLYTSKHCLQ